MVVTHLIPATQTPGNFSNGEFAERCLEFDTPYSGEITRAVSADYKYPENMQQKKGNVIQNMPLDPSSSVGWEGTQWICRSLLKVEDEKSGRESLAAIVRAT